MIRPADRVPAASVSLPAEFDDIHHVAGGIAVAVSLKDRFGLPAQLARGLPAPGVFERRGVGEHRMSRVGMAQADGLLEHPHRLGVGGCGVIEAA